MLDNLFSVYCSTTDEELFSTMKKLSEKRFAKLHSDWPKLLFGSHALVRGHKNLKYLLPHTSTVGQ